jgi:alpha-amylase
MSDKMHFVMVLHCHQPVGNFDRVLAMANNECYRPVIEIFNEYPSFRLGLHFSGPLFNWMRANDPGLFQLIKKMCRRGQAELLSGAFYEPLLAVIPEKDALAQFDLQNKFLHKNFQTQARGFWLAERIWDPSLPRLVYKAGMDYTLVDDTHFYYSGLKENDMFGYRLTEREGHTLALFPTNKQLRYTIPFKEPRETIRFLCKAYERHGPTCATYGDDGEKFGLWPKTNQLVIKKGWLKKFIEAVLEQESWLTTTPPGEYMLDHPPSGRIYLPTSSYEEMLTWAMPADVSLQMENITKRLKNEGRYDEMHAFLRGGLWENFLVKYRESNLMHKKMLHISAQFKEPAPGKAYDHLLQAQCNCSYWHGLFGGLYLGHIRNAVHSNLIAAQSILDHKKFPRDNFVMNLREDMDLDGYDEINMASHVLDCLVHPSYGGSVSMLNLRQARFNLANTLTRRPEAYHHLFEEIRQGLVPAVLASGLTDQEETFSPHDKIVLKEEGLENYLLYDWYDRAVFQDHILPAYVTVEDFRRPNYAEWEIGRAHV